MCKQLVHTVLLGVAVLTTIQNVMSLDAEDVKYFLYSGVSPDTPVEVGPSFLVSRTNLIDTTKAVKILCHGYTDDANSYWIAPTKDAYMAKGDKNVISVDWSKHAFGTYSHATSEAQAIGEHIADLILQMSAALKMPLSQFHCIGHSLGAHISGYAGKKVFEITGQKIGRITGLDPAGPSFNGKSIEHRLSTDDALFVDAIHTDTVIFGFKKTLAHVDFWPNGGSSQNGCSVFSNCSHCRAPIYFYESIGNENFPAWQCGSLKEFRNGKCFKNKKTVMGDNCPSTARGNYYLETNKESPFGITKY